MDKTIVRQISHTSNEKDKVIPTSSPKMKDSHIKKATTKIFMFNFDLFWTGQCFYYWMV